MDLQQFGTWERQTGGQWHLPGTDPEASAEHARTFALVKQFNELANMDHERAKEILREILPEESEVPGMHAPLNLEYGRNLVCGWGVFINFGAGALVTRDIPDKSLVLGAPGRGVRKLEGTDKERVDLDGPLEGFAAGESPF